MSAYNALAALLLATSERYYSHDSRIARDLSVVLREAVAKPIVTSPTEVSPCAALPAIFAASGDPLLAEVATIAHLLYWRLPGRGRIPQQFAQYMASVEIVGPGGMILDDRCRFGLFIQNRNMHYPEHWHEAEELYLVLSGVADWGTDLEASRPVEPGRFIRHAPWQPHVMTTRDDPLLAMWGWTGNLDFSTYTIGPQLSSTDK